MLFLLVRMALFLFLVLIEKFFLKRTLKIKKFKLIILNLIIIISLSVYPIENAFFNFKSAEAAFKYIGTGKIVKVLEGDSSAMVVYYNNYNDVEQQIFRKNDKSYKLPYPNIRTINSFDNEANLTVFRVNEDNECYIFGLLNCDYDEKDLKLFDGSGNLVDSTIFLIDNSKMFYIYSSVYSDGLHFQINSQTIYINKPQTAAAAMSRALNIQLLKY